MRIFRLCQTRFSDSPFDGEGARFFAGRWHTKGQRVSYAALTAESCVLELLVQATHPDTLAAQPYTLVEAEIPEASHRRLDEGALPPGWNRYPHVAATRRIGDEWLASVASLSLEVPGVTFTPPPRNVLINPAHPAYDAIRIVARQPFALDARLLALLGREDKGASE